MSAAVARPTKREAFERFFRTGAVVFLMVDARADGVLVPRAARERVADAPWRLPLNYRLNAVVPLQDLEVTNEGVGATIRFQRQPVWTFVPWSAVYLIWSDLDGGYGYAEDFPAEERAYLRLEDGADALAAPVPSFATAADSGHRLEAMPPEDSAAPSPEREAEALRRRALFRVVANDSPESEA